MRQFCPVDHVEIFQKSTCGWVRVLGKENFETAYGTTNSYLCPLYDSRPLTVDDAENLNGKEFQGRSIIADKRNATQPLVVRDLNTPVPAKRLPGKGSRSAAPMTSESPSYATGGPVCRPESSIYPSPASTTSSSFSQVSLSSMHLVVSVAFQSQPLMVMMAVFTPLIFWSFLFSTAHRADSWNYNVGRRWSWCIFHTVELFKDFRCSFLTSPNTGLRCSAIDVPAEQQRHAILRIWTVSESNPATTAIHELLTIVLQPTGHVLPINFVPSATTWLQ